jgi:LytS/YehU family sensor histidine kinase
MRYCISESNNDRVPLQQEINYITNYIDLQKLRLTSKIKMACEIDGHGDGKYITPFLLIPFIENAFKHGVNSEGNSDIKIKITINKGDIVLEVANNKVYLRQGQEKNTDIGISSTRRRLNLLYPGKHVLDINDGKNDFIVYLKIDFQ